MKQLAFYVLLTASLFSYRACEASELTLVKKVLSGPIEPGLPDEYVAQTYDNRVIKAVGIAKQKQPDKPLTGSCAEIYQDIDMNGILTVWKEHPEMTTTSLIYMEPINDDQVVKAIWNCIQKLLKEKKSLKERRVAWTAYLAAAGEVQYQIEEEKMPELTIPVWIQNIILDNQSITFELIRKLI